MFILRHFPEKHPLLSAPGFLLLLPQTVFWQHAQYVLCGPNACNRCESTFSLICHQGERNISDETILRSSIISCSFSALYIVRYQKQDTMNATDNQSRECNPLGVYGPGEPPVPASLLWAALVHCFCLIVIGTLGNALALWCVVTCRQTRREVKVLLFSVFLPALLVCLVTRPVIGEVRIALLTCDLHRVSKRVLKVNSVVYVFLAQTEVASIAVVAVTRALSVWTPHKPGLGLRGTVVLLTVICVYSALTGMVVMRMEATGALDEAWADRLITTLFFLDATVPALVTTAAYGLIVFVIQRNKRRLAASQCRAREGTMMDHATRAMLAVFISNLIFGIPHSIHHLMGEQPHYMKVIFHVLFSTHFMVDPLAFVWFNSGYRRRVAAKIKRVTQAISPSPSSVLPIESASNHDHHHQHSSKHKQEEVKI